MDSLQRDRGRSLGPPTVGAKGQAREGGLWQDHVKVMREIENKQSAVKPLPVLQGYKTGDVLRVIGHTGHIQNKN